MSFFGFGAHLPRKSLKGPRRVILLLDIGIRKNRVSLIDFFELIFLSWIGVRMIGLSQSIVRLLNLTITRILGDLKDAVVIL